MLDGFIFTKLASGLMWFIHDYRGNIFNVDQLIIAIPSCRVVCATDLLKATYAIPYTGRDLVALHEPSHRPWPAVWR